MSDGWETRRRRGPGHDWVIVKLATQGTVRRIEIDTNHFKGNFPDTASIEGFNGAPASDGAGVELLPRTKLQAHTRHFFVDELANRGPFTHLRMNVFPDGGVSRLRVWGVATEAGRRSEVVEHINTMVDPRTILRSVNGSTKWVDAVAGARPFANWEQMISTSDKVWNSLSPDDHMEAFRAHPRIGEKKEGARWTVQEQSGTQSAPDETMKALAEGNREYEKKFGHIYLVCATGRTADEMLANLRERMKNDPKNELRVAAEEQRKITALRLEKLVSS